MNAVKTVERYVCDTGSTWYKPEKKDLKLFEEAKRKELLSEKGGYYTLPKIHDMEKNIAKYAVVRLHYNEDQRKSYPKAFIDLFIRLYEEKEGIKLDKWQKDGVYRAINSPLFILTGGPGTGKTSVLKCMCYCFERIFKSEDILFTAPTGKAARRITESVGRPASTVARAYGLKDENSRPKKVSNALIIVDEISMLDTLTAHALFSSTSMDSKLILVGDPEQLPSVGYGSVLRDLLDADLPCTKLEKTFRQASESGLFANIENIKLGLYTGFEKRDDFKVIRASTPAKARNIMVSEFLKAKERYSLDQVVCLTPYRRKGENCAIKINEVLQSIINPAKENSPSCSYLTTEPDGFSYRITLRVGDPVMQLSNAELVSNGDVGTVKEIDVDNELVKVQFTGQIVTYNKNMLGDLSLAYAMSVHKSQGSEYACVITSALSDDMDMLSRNTIYTAVTRAKKECIIVTDKDSAAKACKKETGYERITGLTEEIIHQERRFELLSSLLKQQP